MDLSGYLRSSIPAGVSRPEPPLCGGRPGRENLVASGDSTGDLVCLDTPVRPRGESRRSREQAQLFPDGQTDLLFVDSSGLAEIESNIEVLNVY